MIARLAAAAIGTNNPQVLEPEIVQAALDIIEAADPVGFAQVVAYGETGAPGRTLVQFDAATIDVDETRDHVDRIDNRRRADRIDHLLLGH